MDRRTVLKQFVMAGVAAIFLPSCLTDTKKVSIVLNNLKITADDEALLAALAETLIPGTDKPGAKEVGAHLFALVMIDDCLTQTEKEKFITGMQAFNEVASLNGKNFIDASASERFEIISTLEKQKSSSESIQVFYNTSKHFIIQGYTTSSYFLSEVKPYQLIPGPTFKGCEPVNANVKSL